MIFVTVGHQMPFDRLIRAVDDWAGLRDRDDVVAQIGDGTYQPQHMHAERFMSPARFREMMNQADAIVAHAGTGTIIAAMEYRKPLLVMPRRAALGETRNDHQIPTANHFAAAGNVLAACDEQELVTMLDVLERFQLSAEIASQASPELLNRLREFVEAADEG